MTPARDVFSQETADPCELAPHADKREWTLPEIIDQALCHHPQTRQAWANARLRAAQLGVAEAAYLPTINVTTALSRSQNTSGGGSLQNQVQGFSLGGSRQTEQTRFAPTISLNYLLLDFGGREAAAESARRALEAANWSHAASLQNVMFSAIQAYYQLFATQAALDAADMAEKSAEETLKAARIRYEIGAAALADQLQAQTAHAQARVNRQQAWGNLQIALGTLANAMGLKPDLGMRIAPPSLTIPDAEQERNVQSLIEKAKVLRPDLAAAEAQIRAAEANVTSARSGSLPTLSLVGNYSYNNSIGVQSVESWVVGLQVNVPLFTGFTNTYQIRGAEEQVAIQQASRDQLDRSVALDVWRAYYNLATTHETLRGTDDLLASAMQAEKVALGRYKAGAGNILDVLNAQSSLANARFQQVQARYNWLIGRAQLAQALGQLDLAEVDPVSRPARRTN